MYAVNLTVYFRNVSCPLEVKVPRGHSIVAAAGVQQLRPTPTHCLLGLHNTLLANRHYGYTLWVRLVQNTHSSARASLRCELLCEQLCDQLCASAFRQKRRHCPPATLRSRSRRRSIQSLRLTPLGLSRPPGLLGRSSRHWNRRALLCWEGNICGCVLFFFPYLPS